MMICRRSLLGGAAALAAPALARGQPAWPSQMIRIVVPFTPGGSTDVLARLIGHRLEQSFGKPVLIENQAGAGGSIAAARVAQADADGHTLMMGHIGTLAFNPSLYPDLPYDPLRDFAPVALVASVPNLLAISPRLPASSFAAFVTYAKAHPGELNYSSGGAGSAAHIAGAYLAYAAGFEAVHVPYRGTAPSVSDVVAGAIQFTLTGGPAVLPLASSGRLRVLGIASAHRASFAPQVPTLIEAGLPSFEAEQWYGIVAPARTPTPIVERLNGAINALLDERAFADVLEHNGAVALKRTPDAFGRHIAAEIALWRDVIRRAHITAGG